MKPARFSYVAPASLDETLEVLRDQTADVRILAGGQSLGPLLNLRLARPGMILDVNRIPDLDSIRLSPDGSLSVGALTRQRHAETSAHVASGWPLLTEAISQIGHRAIRNRGTVGGSVAHADPAAELPSALIALNATCELASTARTRSVPASRFFQGPFSTVLDPDEMLLGVTVPPVGGRSGQGWLEFSRRHGDFGVVGVGAVLTFDGENRCAGARLVYSGADWTPWQPESALGLLDGEPPTPELFEEVGRAVAAESSPPGDIHASSVQRRRLIETLTSRVLTVCTGRALGEREGRPWL